MVYEMLILEEISITRQDLRVKWKAFQYVSVICLVLIKEWTNEPSSLRNIYILQHNLVLIFNILLKLIVFILFHERNILFQTS